MLRFVNSRIKFSFLTGIVCESLCRLLQWKKWKCVVSTPDHQFRLAPAILGARYCRVGRYWGSFLDQLSNAWVESWCRSTCRSGMQIYGEGRRPINQLATNGHLQLIGRRTYTERNHTLGDVRGVRRVLSPHHYSLTLTALQYSIAVAFGKIGTDWPRMSVSPLLRTRIVDLRIIGASKCHWLSSGRFRALTRSYTDTHATICTCVPCARRVR